MVDLPDNIEVLGDAIFGLADVSFALAGKEGVALARKQLPDLILLDVMMPDMNGYEVFAELQIAEETAHIPIIFVTARNDSLSETAALNAGAVDFIAKPINPAVAKARVRVHLSLREKVREVQQLNKQLEHLMLERKQAVGDELMCAH